MSIQAVNVVKIKPNIPASLQHTEAFDANDVLFDWTEFKVPRGANRLIGLQALIRGTNGVRQEQPFDLYFSESNSFSLGTVNSAVSMQPNNDLIGSVAVLKSHYTDGINTMEVADVPTNQRLIMVGAREPEDFDAQAGGRPGYHVKSGGKVMYIAGVAQDALDFQSTVKTTLDITNGTANDITVDTTSALINFAPGDLLHAHDNAVIGTVGSIPDATSIILKGNTTNQETLANNDDIYNLNPITILLNFTYTT